MDFKTILRNNWVSVGQLVVGGILAIEGLITLEYDWGIIAVTAAAGFILTGISAFLPMKK